MKPVRQIAISAVLLLVLPCLAQTARSVRVVTDPNGTRLEYSEGDATGESGSIAGVILWDSFDEFPIPQSLATSDAANSVWVGQYLNNQRVERYELTGDGTPLDSIPAAANSAVAVSAADGADRAVVVDGPSGAFVLKAFHSGSAVADWTYAFAANYNYADLSGVKVSRDGQIVCCLVNDTVGAKANLHIFDGVTGALLRNWNYNALASGIDLSDDGSLCLVTQGSFGRLIDTATALEIFSAPGSGSGSRHKISGNGEVLGVGGFSLHVYKKIAGVYTLKINFTAASSWFGWGLGISRDGTTVGVLSHNYASGYLLTTTRVFDVDSAALLGQYDTTGTGGLQDAISGGVVSDDGSIIAVSSWGTADNAHPEVMIFDRAANLIGSVDTIGSVFSLDATPDGQYVVSGNKAAHANNFGRGGDVICYEVFSGACEPCDTNCDGSINQFDIVPFVQTLQSQSGCSPCAADSNEDGSINQFDIAGFVECLGG